MFGSIRVTLTLWYIGILAAILCVFSYVLYSNIASNFSTSIDERLVSQADGIAETVSTFWLAEWQAKHKSTLALQEKRLALLPRTLQREISKGRFKVFIERWAEETKILEIAGRPFRILQLNGEVIISHPSFDKLTRSLVIRSPYEQAKLGATFYQIFMKGSDRVRLVTRPVVEKGQVLYIVQVVTSLQEQDETLEGLRFWLYLLIPLTLIFASVIGWFLATLALRPVGKMTAQAERVSARQLHERLDVPRTRDELERLAKTFNEMLSRLERAFKRMRQFSAAASHELRTPLTILKGELEVALRKPRDLEEYRRVLATQLEAVNEIISIVEQLLALAHTEEGEGAVEWQKLNLGDLVRQVCQRWQKIIDDKKIHLEISQEKEVEVRGEKRLLERLVANLLDNAVKHTPGGGAVAFEIAERNHSACLVVKDTGPGISKEELPKIFDKFFSRAVSQGAEGSASGGVGLGLGLCRWIVEAHQGQIEVSSIEGQGAKFTVRLPKL